MDASFRPWTGTPTRGEYTVLVHDVHDGDSFTACLLVPIRCRVVGVNSPELRHKGGMEAQRNTESLILGKQLPARLLGRDKYGRTLTDLMLGGRWLSGVLLESGQAVPYGGHQFSREP